MMPYKFEFKKVFIDGREFEAIFPAKHSMIKAVVYNWYDENHGDPYANISAWRCDHYILYKGTGEWRLMPPPARGLSPIDLLLSLETHAVRERTENKMRIVELKAEIKRNQEWDENWTSQTLRKSIATRP